MTDTPLFPDLPEVLSPKLAWIRANDVETEQLEFGGQECPETGDDIPRWVCRKISPKGIDLWRECEIGGGDTEDEAMLDYCTNANVKHWSIESTP